MSEVIDEASAGPESNGAGAGPAALALALAGASREDAHEFLKKQGRLVELQSRELEHELELRHWSLWVRHASGVLKLALELSAGLLLLFVVTAIGVMVWNAAHSDGLIVESFTVPPELAEKGLTGQVVASQLTDRLTAMQAATNTIRAARSYANNWGDDIKVEIPETGVSIGEAYRFLKNWLGHETHVGGEVWKTDSGITIAARISGGGGSSVMTGSAGDLDSLIQKTAEDIYGRTQPYRYAAYLASHGRPEQALVIFKSLAQTGLDSERGWGYFGWANLARNTEGPVETERLFKAATEYGLANAFNNLAGLENSLGRVELARTLTKQAQDATAHDSGMTSSQAALFVRSVDAQRAGNEGDYATALEIRKGLIAARTAGSIASPSYGVAATQIDLHDLAGARMTLENPLPSSGTNPVADKIARIARDVQMAMAAEDWSKAYAADRAELAVGSKFPGVMAVRRTNRDPQSAFLAAKLGKFA